MKRGKRSAQRRAPGKETGRGPVLLEACVTCVREARAVIEAGADRVELCTRLDVGGLTPRTGLLRSVVETTRFSGTPVFAMLRPRAGGFALARGDAARVLGRIQTLREAGADGIVLGFLESDGTIEAHALEALVAAADPLPVTFHRAFDETPSLEASYEALARAGVQRVLTAGGARTAWEGRTMLARLVRMAGEGSGPTILGAGGVRADHLLPLLEATGLEEVHARASAFPELARVGRRPRST